MADVPVLSGPIANYAESVGNVNSTAALTAGRYYTKKLPSDPVYPAVVISEVASDPDTTAHNGSRVFTAVRIQIDVYAETKAAAAAVGALLFNSFNGLSHSQIGSSLPSGGAFILSCLRQLRLFQYDQDLEAWRYTQDFNFNV